MSKKSVIDKHCRKRRGKNTRLTIPFNLMCLKCKYTLPKSKKLYANRLLSNETYLGVPIFLFEFPCPDCRINIVFKTDPKEGDYKPFSNCKIVNSIISEETFTASKPIDKVEIDELKNRILKKFENKNN